jgi:hypothetical protein
VSFFLILNQTACSILEFQVTVCSIFLLPFLQIGIRVVWRTAHETAGRCQQPAGIRGRPEHLPAHEKAGVLTFNSLLIVLF